MKHRIWLAAAMISVTAPLQAQPENPNENTTASDNTSIAELERAIGGRTTLELKFKDLKTAAVIEAISTSSGLRFVAPPQALPQTPSPGVGFNLHGLTSNPLEEQTWDGNVAKTDFWLALRRWGRAENVRLKREREALQQQQKDELPPLPPQLPEGQKATPEELEKSWTLQREWSQRRTAALASLNPDATLSAFYNAGTAAWNLVPNSELIVGDAFNVWPCLVLATRFRRQQNLSISKPETAEKLTEEKDNKTTPDKTTPDQAQLIQTPVLNERGEEATADGFLSDALFMNLEVYVDPKMLQKATVHVRVNQAHDETGENLLFDTQNRVSGGTSVISYSSYGSQDSRITHRVQLLPRQAKGRRIAVLGGIVTIRYPMKSQQHEITHFNGSQPFSLATDDLPIQAQFEPPQVKNGMLMFSTAVKLESNRGARRLLDNLNVRRQRDNRQGSPLRITGAGMIMSGKSDSTMAYRSPLGQMLLPSQYTFIDSQGRTWVGASNSVDMILNGPDGKPIPVTSPPTPPPDDFTYNEKRSGYLQLMPENGALNGRPATLSPEELAQVRFTKASFTTESDWRTLEVPFEFRDLPLPPR